MYSTHSNALTLAHTHAHPHTQLQRAMSDALNSGEFATSLKIGVGDATGAAAVSTSPGASLTSRQQAPRPPSPTSRAQQPRPPLPRAAPDVAPQHQQPASASGEAGSGVRAAAPAAHQPPGSVSQPLQPPVQQQQQQQQQLVTRNWFFQQGPPRPVLTLYTVGPVPVGTPIQIHLQ